MTTNPFRLLCAQCQSPLREGSVRCWNCGSTETIPNPEWGKQIETPVPVSRERLFVPPAERYSTDVPTRVEVVDLRLTWGAAFDIAFKFSIILLLGQIVVLLLAYLLFR